MNLLDRIDQRLAAPASINRHDFEECAIALLSDLYPGLVPITGGTDYGLDGELTVDGVTIGFIVTSSRTWDGARASLRNSLKSVRRNQLPVNKVVAADLVSMNRQRREKLRAIATEFDCELLEVYDLPWFANQFRESPDWRQKILGIAGGLFSFSRQPRGARPDALQLPTVGRDELIAELNDSAGDMIIHGVPGAGKSHIAAMLKEALFLERHPTPERLLDDLITAKPTLVVVDDAGARTQDIESLISARDVEALTFAIAATCWPHEVDAVADHLPGADRFEVDLLTRAEIGQLLRQRGVTRSAVIANLLEQAAGRPAWALNLADLLITSGDWQSVWTGTAVREKVLTFLRASKASADAFDVLATMALVGSLEQDQLPHLARLLELRGPDITRLINSVAIAGLIDVQEHVRYDRATQQSRSVNSYQVRPPVIAAAIAAKVFFAQDAPPVQLDQVWNAFPDRASSVVQMQIYTSLLGAARPAPPTVENLLAVLPSADPVKQTELLRSFAELGPTQTKFVINLYADWVAHAAAAGNHMSAAHEGGRLADRVAAALETDTSDVLAPFIAALTLVHCQGWDAQGLLSELVKQVRDPRNGDRPQLESVTRLAGALSTPEAADLPSPLWVGFACEILAPTFDGNYMSAEVPLQAILTSFTWSGDSMETLFASLEPDLTARIPAMTTDELLDVIGLLDKWVRIAAGYDLPFGGVVTDDRKHAGRAIAQRIAAILTPAITTPGLRARFNKVSANLGVKLSEPDLLFAALTDGRDAGENYRHVIERRQAALDEALAPYLREPPDTLLTWLVDRQGEFAVAGEDLSVSRVLLRVAQLGTVETGAWLAAVIEHGLAAHASQLIYVCARSGQLTRDTAAMLQADPGSRAGVIAAVVGESTDDDLVNDVIGTLTRDDITSGDSAYALKEMRPATRHALFTTPDPAVRGTAAALWAAEWSYDDAPMPHDADWRSAVADFTLEPRGHNSHLQDQALKAIAAAAPDTFADLLARHAATTSSFDDFQGWQGSVPLLDAQQRHALWARVRHVKAAQEFFWVLAGADATWVHDAVSDPAFDIPLARLLSAYRFQFAERFPLDALASALRPLNWEPDDLLCTLEVGTWVGEDYERYARNLETVRDLARSTESDIAALGARGVEIYEPKLAQALAQERKRAIRGHEL